MGKKIGLLLEQVFTKEKITTSERHSIAYL
jgi:hypothetical protein